jgi:5'-3' exonuclease
MGIKNLSKYLRDKSPEVFKTIHISEYALKKVAIDTSLYMYHFKAICGDAWLGAFFRLVALLRENHVHCVFVYDNGCPPEKEAERKERQDARNKLEEKVFNLEQAIDDYHNLGEISSLLTEFQTSKKLDPPRLLKQNSGINIKAIEYAVQKLKKQIFTITPKDFADTRELFDILQVPYIIAPLEAETTCSDLCIQGKVDAVLTEDTDVLAYGTPVFLTKINTGDGTCVQIKYEDVLGSFEYSAEQFLDFCIMCGTDYNKNIFKVGPVKAYSLIKEHKSIEDIKENTVYDVSILNHVRVRELFRDYKKWEDKVGFCGAPDFEKLQLFLTKKNLRTNLESLYKSFTNSNIVIVEDDEGEEEEEIIEEDE